MARQPSFLARSARLFARLDLSMMLLVGILIVTGSLFIYGTGQQIGGRFEGYWIRQLVWIAAGAAGFAAMVVIDYRKLGLWSGVLFLFGLALLVLVLFIGKEINSARSWLRFGGVTLQPAELAKPATVFFLAWLASRSAFRLNRFPDLCCFGCAAALPVLLIARQPDWGTALVFVPAALAIAFIAGLPWRYILLTAIVTAILLPVAYQFALGERQKERILTFLSPSEDISDAGWNAHQSLLAVGSGQNFGKGFMRGNQHRLGYLPRTVAPTDFIFSVIGEETGFVGAGAVVCAFLGILICCLHSAAVAPDRFGACLCVGVAAIIFTHVYINIGMTIRAAPIIGIPLPFLSYGGSFMVGMMLCIGLVESVHVRRGRDDRTRR
jgi:rod shape determining protein RodA